MTRAKREATGWVWTPRSGVFFRGTQGWNDRLTLTRGRNVGTSGVTSAKSEATYQRGRSTGVLIETEGWVLETRSAEGREDLIRELGRGRLTGSNLLVADFDRRHPIETMHWLRVETRT